MITPLGPRGCQTCLQTDSLFVSAELSQDFVEHSSENICVSWLVMVRRYGHSLKRIHTNRFQKY